MYLKIVLLFGIGRPLFYATSIRLVWLVRQCFALTSLVLQASFHTRGLPSFLTKANAAIKTVTVFVPLNFHGKLSLRDHQQLNYHRIRITARVLVKS